MMQLLQHTYGIQPNAATTCSERERNEESLIVSINDVDHGKIIFIISSIQLRKQHFFIYNLFYCN
jgi:hypothetical protein